MRVPESRTSRAPSAPVANDGDRGAVYNQSRPIRDTGEGQRGARAVPTARPAAHLRDDASEPQRGEMSNTARDALPPSLYY